MKNWPQWATTNEFISLHMFCIFFVLGRHRCVLLRSRKKARGNARTKKKKYGRDRDREKRGRKIDFAYSMTHFRYKSWFFDCLSSLRSTCGPANVLCVCHARHTRKVKIEICNDFSLSLSLALDILLLLTFVTIECLLALLFGYNFAFQRESTKSGRKKKMNLLWSFNHRIFVFPRTIFISFLCKMLDPNFNVIFFLIFCEDEKKLHDNFSRLEYNKATNMKGRTTFVAHFFGVFVVIFSFFFSCQQIAKVCQLPNKRRLVDELSAKFQSLGIGFRPVD